MLSLFPQSSVGATVLQLLAAQGEYVDLTRDPDPPPHTKSHTLPCPVSNHAPSEPSAPPQTGDPAGQQTRPEGSKMDLRSEASDESVMADLTLAGVSVAQRDWTESGVLLDTTLQDQSAAALRLETSPVGGDTDTLISQEWTDRPTAAQPLTPPSAELTHPQTPSRSLQSTPNSEPSHSQAGHSDTPEPRPAVSNSSLSF